MQRVWASQSTVLVRLREGVFSKVGKEMARSELAVQGAQEPTATFFWLREGQAIRVKAVKRDLGKQPQL